MRAQRCHAISTPRLVGIYQIKRLNVFSKHFNFAVNIYRLRYIKYLAHTNVNIQINTDSYSRATRLRTVSKAYF